MNDRKWRWWIGGGILVVLVVAACAAPEMAVQETVEVQEIEKVIEKTVVLDKEVEIATPAASEEITVRAWAADEFEEQAINEMVDRFRDLHPEITVHLIVVTPGGVR